MINFVGLRIAVLAIVLWREWLWCAHCSCIEQFIDWINQYRYCEASREQMLNLFEFSKIRNKRIINGFAHSHYYPFKSLISKNRLINHSHMRWSHCSKYGTCFVFAAIPICSVRVSAGCLAIQYIVQFFVFLLIAVVRSADVNGTKYKTWNPHHIHPQSQ